MVVSVLGYLSIVWTTRKGRSKRALASGNPGPVTFGHLPDGTEIVEYTLRNRRGMTAKILNYGATLRTLEVPDRHGIPADVVLGFENLDGYLAKHPYFGGTIGRYANRIARGQFRLEGRDYQLAINDPPHSLHGGTTGFDRRVWTAALVENEHGPSVRLTYVSKDGEEHYRGTLTASVTYTLSDENELKLEYQAETDRSTPINLTNHSYFNLAGGGDILNHVLSLNADNYTPVDATLIPTGKIQSVANTPLDFRTPALIGARIGKVKEFEGYDHNFVVNGGSGTLRLAAWLSDPKSGRQMEVWTSEPGIQFYAGLHLDGSVVGKAGVAYKKYSGLCLEPQHFPDSPNHPDFPTTILSPGSRFRSESVYKFFAK